MVARAVELAQTDDQIAVDDATADIAAGDVVLDRLRALMDVDRVRSGQDVTEGQRDVGLALFDQDGGRGAEGLAGGQLRDVAEGSDDVAEVIAGSRVDVRRMRRIRFLSPGQRGAHRDDHHQHRHRRHQGHPTSRNAMTLNLLHDGACLRPDQFADLLFDLVHLGKAIQGILGEDLSPVEEDFERSRLTGSDRHRPELFVVIVQQILRQTGGSREIPSGGAVLDPHHWLLPRRRLAGSVVGHASPPFVSLPRGWLNRISHRICTWRECRMEGSPARPRLVQPVARRVPREAGRLHPEMSGHASWGSRGPRFLAHDRRTPTRLAVRR